MRKKKMGQEINWTCLGPDCPDSCCGPCHHDDFSHDVPEVMNLGDIMDEHPNRSEITRDSGEIRLIQKDVERLRSAGQKSVIIKRKGVNGTRYYLELDEHGTCSMLNEDGSCSIYEYRPTLCRAFPFYFDLFNGLCILESCPGIGKGMTPLEEIEDQIRAAIEMYRFWLDKDLSRFGSL